MIVKGRLTRHINNKNIRFSIYIDGEFPDNPISWANELTLELSDYLPIKPISLLEINEKRLNKVGRLNEYFVAKRQFDDIKLTKAFCDAFINLLNDFKKYKLIDYFKTTHVKVNPNDYPYNKVKGGIVLCEVPILLFEFKTKQ